MGLDVKDSIVGFTQPGSDLVSAFIGGQDNPTIVSASVPQGSWSFAMGKIGTEVQMVSYSRTAGVLSRFTAANAGGTPSLTFKYALTVTGVTPPNQIGAGQGGWYVVLFSSGPAAGKGAFLSAADELVVFFDVATMAETKRVTLTGTPFRIVADETHGNLIVANADPAAGLTRYDSVAPSTGTVTRLQSTSTLLSVGLAVSADGTKIYSGMRDKAEALPNQ